MKNFMKAAFLSVAMLLAKDAYATTKAEFNKLSDDKQFDIIYDTAYQHGLKSRTAEEVNCIADTMYAPIPGKKCSKGLVDIIGSIKSAKEFEQVEHVIKGYLIGECRYQ